MASCQRKDISPQPSMACVLAGGTEERKDLLGLCSVLWQCMESPAIFRREDEGRLVQLL